MVSMKDIAKKCGVSIATVSKALNGQSDIGEATRVRIKKIADEMGYYPNAAARALKSKRSYNIGVMFKDNAHSGLTHEYFAAVLEGFKVQAESQGYDLTFINTHIGKSRMTYYEHCQYRNVDGVVIACGNYSDPEVLDLLNREIPTVTIDHVCHNWTSVVSDNVAGIRELILYIYEMGHRRIAYIHGEHKSSVTKDRVASFYQTCEELGITVDENYVEGINYLNSAQAEVVTNRLLNLKTPPTCIVYPDDFALIGGRNVIADRGLSIPKDISIAGYDGSKMSQVLNPKLTTIKQNTEVIGREAAKELIASIENSKSTLVKRIVVKGQLLMGDSVGRI